MLMILGHNPLGNVIHMIVGPETELFEDIHGSKIVDLTSILQQAQKDEHVFVNLTRCKSEAMTEGMLKAMNITYISSFTGMPEAGVNPSVRGMPQQDDSKDHRVIKDRCQYCKRETELVNIPGYKICPVCAQIELGQLKTKKRKDVPSDAK